MSTATPTAPATEGDKRKQVADPRLTNGSLPKYTHQTASEIGRRADFKTRDVYAAAIECFSNLTPDEQFNHLVEAKRRFGSYTPDAAAGE